MQECPSADAAIIRGVVGVLKWLTEQSPSNQGPSSTRVQMAIGVEPLREVLDRVTQEGERAMVGDAGYLAALGCGGGKVSAGEVWRSMFEKAGVRVGSEAGLAPLKVILEKGPLARRMVEWMGSEQVTRERLKGLAVELCDCLAADRMQQTRSASGGQS